jgi:inner membrane transporter RhtA
MRRYHGLGLAPCGLWSSHPLRSDCPESAQLSFPYRPVAALMGSLVSLCVGTSFAKTLFPHMGALGMSAWRIGLAAVLLALVLRPWRRRWQAADLPPLALYGVTLGTMNLLFYLSIARIPLGLAIAIEFTGPLAVALWTSHRKLDLLWVALAAIGLALILPLQGLQATGALDPQGIALALAAGVCWGLYIVIGQHVARRYGRDAAPMGMLAGALVVVPLGLAQSGLGLLRPEWLWPALVVATLSSALPYALEIYALTHLPKRSFSILLSLEPAVGAVAAWIMLSEALSTQQWLAIAFVMAASMGSAWSVSPLPARENGNPAPP